MAVDYVFFVWVFTGSCEIFKSVPCIRSLGVCCCCRLVLIGLTALVCEFCGTQLLPPML